MKKLQNKVAAITGAASGIGQDAGVRLAMESCNLALADIDAKGLWRRKKMSGRVQVQPTRGRFKAGADGELRKRSGLAPWRRGISSFKHPDASVFDTA